MKYIIMIICSITNCIGNKNLHYFTADRKWPFSAELLSHGWAVTCDYIVCYYSFILFLLSLGSKPRSWHAVDESLWATMDRFYRLGIIGGDTGALRHTFIWSPDGWCVYRAYLCILANLLGERGKEGAAPFWNPSGIALMHKSINVPPLVRWPFPFILLILFACQKI